MVVRGGGSGWGGQGGCERRIEVFVKIPKKNRGGGVGGSGWGVGVGLDINEKRSFWENSKKENWGGGWGVRGGRVGGVRLDVNEEL